MPDDGRVVIDLTGDDDDAPVFSPPPARAPPAKFRMLYVEPVLARYEGELHFPARRLYSYQSTCVEFVNGERRELEKDDVVNRSDPRFQRVKLGKLPMAAPGDTRSLEERRAAGGYDAPAIPNLAERLRLTLPLLKRIALGEEGHLWRFQDFKKGTVAASKRCLNGSVGGFFDGNEMMEIALWVSENTRNFETVAENETLRRRLLVDVLIPEGELFRGCRTLRFH